MGGKAVGMLRQHMAGMAHACMHVSTYVVGLAVMVAGVMAAGVMVVALVEEVKEAQLLDTDGLHT